jgi:hypothetical protein
MKIEIQNSVRNTTRSEVKAVPMGEAQKVLKLYIRLKVLQYHVHV